MPPTTSRDFMKAAEQRLTVARVLLGEDFTLDAQYIGGYAVECALKALILHLTPDSDRPDALERITSGARMHRSDVLFGELRDLGVAAPTPLTKRLVRFVWSTDLRYETGRLDHGETIAFLRTAQSVYDWVKGQLP